MILTSKIRIPLERGWVLHVVNAGPNASVILSFNDSKNSVVRERVSAHLDHAQAIALGQALVCARKQCIALGEGWDLYVNRGADNRLILSFTEGGDGPVRERISVHLASPKADHLARALAGVGAHPAKYTFDGDDDEDTI